MQEKYVRFGDFIRQKRLDDPRELTMKDVAEFLGVSAPYVSDVENRRKRPFNEKILAQLAEYYEMSEDEKAKMYDLVSIENRGEMPYDIADTLMYEEAGDLARFALRQTKAGFITEADWKTFIRQMEQKKAESKGESKGPPEGTDKRE